MKHLHFLRHAKSSWDDPGLDDMDRPLAPRGVAAAALMARHLDAQPWRPELIVVSTAVRARATFDALCRVYDGIPVLFEQRLYTFSAAHLIDRLRGLDDALGCVLVVGHNPAMHEAAMALTQDQHPAPPELATLRDKFPTAALASLDCAIDRWTDLGPGTATLAALVRPRDLERT